MFGAFRSRKKFLVRVAVVSVICVCGLVGYKLYIVYQVYFGARPDLPLQEPDLSDLSDDTLSHYYLHTKGKFALVIESGVFSTPAFDDAGIPLVDYQGKRGIQYNPVRVSHYALENWELFLQGDEEKRKTIFLRQADWLVKHQQQHGQWFFHFALEDRGIEPPWVSGMAQGMGISVLLRAHQLTGKGKYLAASEKAFAVFQIPIERGGVVCKTDAGTWIEEYPKPSAPTHVLNGHIWALFGVWDMWRVTENPDALKLFREGIAVLKADLHKFDTGYWVKYDLPPPGGHLMSARYMNSQVHQLRLLHAITQDPIFSTYATRWDKYRRNRGSFWRIVCRKIPRKVRIWMGK